MDQKLVAGLVAAVVISPICALCVLGPAVIGSVFAGAFGWLGGFGPLATVALMIAAGALVYRHVLRARTQAPPPPHHQGSSADGSRAAQARAGWSRMPDGRSDAAGR